ncbi:MAG: hypothetical protein A3F72_00115 [Bacteroidetes bacterium RIFCSPLOWO2_12_FULL_35_15]|nr:MAG: hypothetical protein A3F72_00115 [Bacteroidetes bacterium RIFCSPLOWO2_12_FULL_35_15]
MIKIKLLICCLLGLGTIGTKAQDAVPAMGADASGSGGSASYTVGQVIYTSVGSASGSVNQGIQQPYVLLAIGVNSNPDINLTMTVYPNPSATIINLKIEKTNLQNLSFQLYDVQGKLLLKEQITNSETTILLNEYSSGDYFLKVINNKDELKTFKIIKN